MAASPHSDIGALSLRARLSLVAAAFLALLLVVGAFTVASLRHWTDAVEGRRSARDAVADVSDLQLAMSDQESGLRGFVLAADDQFLQPYFSGRELAAAALVSLQRRGGADVDRAVGAVRVAADRWRDEAALPMMAATRRGDVVDQDQLDLSKQRFDDVRSSLAALDVAVSAAMQRAENEVTEAQRRAVVVGLAGFGLAVGGAIVVMLLFRRWVTRPLTEISVATRAIGRGESVSVPRFDAAELASVWDGIDFLQRSLSAERDRAVRAYRTLEQSAVLALHVRAELAADERLVMADGWNLASSLRPAEGLIAGDCFDIGLVNPRLLYLIVIDVTGHGAVAALNALKAKSMLRSAVKSGMWPGEALAWLSSHVAERGDVDYLTAFVATVEVATGRCSYANAGHPPAVVVGAGEVHETLGATGPLLGPFEAEWSTSTVFIEPDHTLVVYTDGLTEARVSDHERLGEARLTERLVTAADTSAEAVVAELLDLFERSAVGVQADDVTVVALTRSTEDTSGTTG